MAALLFALCLGFEHKYLGAALFFYLTSVMQLRWLGRKVGNFRFVTFFAYPVVLIFFQWVFCVSLSKQKRGMSAKWKGRDVQAAHSG
jgi:hypothetical protein